MDIDERSIKINLLAKNNVPWFLDLNAADSIKLPFKKINQHRLDCKFENMNYFITTEKGIFSKPSDSTVVRISPEKNGLVLNMAATNKTK